MVILRRGARRCHHLAASARTFAQCEPATDCTEFRPNCDLYPEDPCNNPETPCKSCYCCIVDGQQKLFLCTTEDGAGCTNGDVCITGEECQGGACTGGEPRCDNFDQCYTQYCHQDCPFYCCDVYYPPGTPCDNGLFCDGPDACNGAGLCGPVTGTSDNPCPIEYCDGYCNEVEDRCDPPPDCHEEPIDNKCTRDWCNPDGGYCRHDPKVCNDENVCNGYESCNTATGACDRGDPPDCDDENPCTDDSCDAQSGCEHENNSRSCDDGNACTKNDHCQDGNCAGEERICNDSNVCNGLETCNTQTGCKKGTPLDCDDGLPCTTDRCHPTEGCEHGCFAIPTTKGLIPKKDDRTFVYEGDHGLGTGTSIFDNHLKVTRYAGPVDGNGYLQYSGELIADQLAGPYGVLTIYMQGVLPGTQHKVSFNGGPQVVLASSRTCGWSTTVISNIPLAQVKFPAARGNPGSPPTPRANTITITVNAQPQCLRFRGASLRVKLMSPIILIHGNNQQGGFFVDRGITLGLDFFHLLWDNSITMFPPRNIRVHAGLLNLSIPAIARSFGVDSLHAVAHSKGGLDAREYLATFYKRGTCKAGPYAGTPCQTDDDCGPEDECKRPFEVLSLTTLSTPHNGSVLADVAEQRRAAARISALIDFDGFPQFANALTYLVANDDDAGRPDLQTWTCAAFNHINIDTLPPDTAYNAIGADADSNGNARIDASPDEFFDLRAESPALAALYSKPVVGPTWAAYAVNVPYQVLRSWRLASVEVEEFSRGPMPILVKLIGVETGETHLNDTFVSIDSALGAGSLDDRTFFTAELTGGNARNHASIANYGIAERIKPWLKIIEQDRGDLRN